MQIRVMCLFFLAIMCTAALPCHALEWATIYGGKGWDEPRSIQPTTDGGFIVVGETSSFRDGHRDVWVLKLDSQGAIGWQKIFGGNTAREDANAWSVQQATDGGYIVVGEIFDLGTESPDILVIKLTANGDIEWENRYGGSFLDVARSVDQTSDGGFIIAGNTRSDAGRAFNDFWVLRLDSSGNTVWQQTYGTSEPEQGFSVQQTADGGYTIAGYTEPDPFDFRNADAWVLKLYPDGQPTPTDQGAVEWQWRYDNSNGDQVYAIRQTLDGGYIVTGITNSLYRNSPNDDLWVVKLLSDGTIDWEKSYGGDGADVGWDVKQIADGGYVVAGATATRCFSVGCADFWMLKLDANGFVIWEKTFGGNFCDYAHEIHENQDGGYIVTGDTSSFGSPKNGHEFLVLKLDANGDIPGCNALATSSGTVSNTSATLVHTNVTPVETTVIPSAANLVSQDTLADERDACFAPYIDEILPAFSSGRRLSGKTISLIGDNFGDTQGDSVVHINGKSFDSMSSKIRIWTDKLIRIKTPKYECTKFNSMGFKKREAWVTVGEVDSNVWKFKLTKPETCP